MDDSAKRSILIIDNDKAGLRYLNSLLSADYSIFTAEDGPEAVNKAKEILPNLILLNILMPGTSGYEALTGLKSSKATQGIPVIFITALNSNYEEEKGLALNAVDYITKPFNAATVKLRIRNQIRIINQVRTIERLSVTDQLTKIANRGSFDQRLNTEWRRAIRYKHPISIMMTDVDGFKIYNDTYGCQQGDIVLQKVAATLTQTLRRPADFTARWSGERFAVLLPMTDINGALVMAEFIRVNIEGLTIPGSDGTAANITVSIGVNAHIPAQSDSVNDFISAADKALCAAKEKGGNRACRSIPDISDMACL
jgi:diguanylate cyclase (GGDEF)-like protein